MLKHDKSYLATVSKWDICSNENPNGGGGGLRTYCFFEKAPGVFRFVTFPLEFPES